MQKAKDRYHNGSGKEEAERYYIANKDVLKEKAISIKPCQKKKKSQKENIAKIGIEIWNKMWTNSFKKIK